MVYGAKLNSSRARIAYLAGAKRGTCIGCGALHSCNFPTISDLILAHCAINVASIAYFPSWCDVTLFTISKCNTFTFIIRFLWSRQNKTKSPFIAVQKCAFHLRTAVSEARSTHANTLARSPIKYYHLIGINWKPLALGTRDWRHAKGCSARNTHTPRVQPRAEVCFN